MGRKPEDWILIGWFQASSGFLKSNISVWMVKAEGNQHLPRDSHRQWDFLAYTLTLYSSFTKILSIEVVMRLCFLRDNNPAVVLPQALLPAQ
jgi:hypothetical protein